MNMKNALTSDSGGLQIAPPEMLDVKTSGENE
jgi:hypothetical protein